jgi:glucose-6-phosphate 1-dehydrogenase
MTQPTTIVIFGATGDLTQRKLIPALFNLHHKKRLPADFRIVGFSRRAWSDDEFRAAARTGVDKLAGIQVTDEEWAQFAPHVFYRRDGLAEPLDLAHLAAMLSELEGGPANRLYYLATPPNLYAPIVTALGQAGLAAQTDGWRRVVIEKPFGRDLASAQELNQSIHQVLTEDQIYRIDHYLGKETVQNVLVFRFANTIFEPIWNRNYIDNVQITVAEDVGVGHRAEYYDEYGVLRDMFQNHLLQLLTLIALEPPASFSADAVRNERVKVLSAVRPIPANQVSEHTVRGQYRGYRSEPGVSAGSQTATFAALRLYVDNWRWQGVPFYLRSGKLMAEKRTEIVIQFRCPPHVIFNRLPEECITANVLTLCLQPDEGIHLQFEAKVPDTVADMRSVNMEFHHKDSFGASVIPEAYERLLCDSLNGDASLFTRNDQIELAWALMDPVLEGWAASVAPPLQIYEPGSWGPARSDAFLARDGRGWLLGCGSHGM